jgi:glyceraldehyde-3-phosphate dehydrogenase (NAD(P))
MIKVGVVGYGTIGKRVADAVLLQDDMELAGVTANTYNYKIESAIRKGISIFPIEKIHLLLNEVDIVVDCTPKGVGADNKETYSEAGVKAIFQGGEKPDVGFSFVAQCNYDKAVGKDFIRVVSCNTTGLCRTLKALDCNYNIDKVHATMIRRAADPWDIYHGPINALVPHLVVPSHHGPDVRTILPKLEIFTTSISVPTTLMHMHSIAVDLNTAPTVEEVVDLFQNTTRVRVVHNSDGIRSTAEIMEYAKDLGRDRGDMPEVCVWSDTIGVWGKKLLYIQAIHQESDVVPENIDAIRAAFDLYPAASSIQKTNKSLGI